MSFGPTNAMKKGLLGGRLSLSIAKPKEEREGVRTRARFS
jgi:hypothetical protein